jgi:membrane protein DedA with SNARE-associated domain
MSKTAARAAQKLSGRYRDEGTSRVHGVDYLQHLQIGNLDFSWLAKFASLIILPFADEDFAIILGGYIVVNKLMPVGLVAGAIYVGMVASDFAFYAIGAAARHLPWLSRFAVNERVRSFAETLKRNVFELVAFCRVVPGIDLIVFIACGWTRVPVARFLLASLVVSALYLPLMLYLVVVFGDALDDHVGLWTWPFLLGAVVIIGFVRNRIFSLREAEPCDGPGEVHRLHFAEARRRSPVAGMTLGRLDGGPRALRWFRLR